jgi:protein-ribulosamine 3-kinase
MIHKKAEKLFLNIVKKYSGKPGTILNTNALSGGSINYAYQIRTTENYYFLKWNHSSKYPGMFEQEAKGLEILRNANEIYVPEVIGFDSDDEISLIVLEYVEQVRQTKNFWENFGTSLANLHKHHEDKFGLEHNNYIGSLMQYNDYHQEWNRFFISQRLEIQIRRARDKGIIEHSLIRKFETLYKYLSDFFPEENPSLIHGDLWSGNYMTNSQGEACIMDPAVYYGHRLMDIGMSMLFGGFAPEFYNAYNRAYPMEKNWKEGAEIANLYPLLVHVNLFGSGYLGSVKSALSRF